MSIVSIDGKKSINTTTLPPYRFAKRPAPACLDCRSADDLMFSTPSRKPGQGSDTTTPASAATTPAPSRPNKTFQGCKTATGASTSSAALLSQDTGARAINAALPPTGTGAFNAAPLSQGMNQATRLCASSAVPLRIDKRARAPRVDLPSHMPRSTKSATPAHCSPSRGCYH